MNIIKVKIDREIGSNRKRFSKAKVRINMLCKSLRLFFGPYSIFPPVHNPTHSFSRQANFRQFRFKWVGKWLAGFCIAEIFPARNLIDGNMPGGILKW